MSDRQGADARRDATSGHFVCFRCPGAGALDQVNQVRILEGQLTAELTARDPLKATQGVVMIRRRSIACPIRSIWRCSGICVAGKRPNLLSRHYRGWPHFRLHSPRAERIREKTPVTPSARSVQTKK